VFQDTLGVAKRSCAVPGRALFRRPAVAHDDRWADALEWPVLPGRRLDFPTRL